MNGLKPSCRMRVNAAGDWQLLPFAGLITQIGDAAVGIVAANEDDLYVTGKVEVQGNLYITGTNPLLNAMEVFECYLPSSAGIQIREHNSDTIMYFNRMSEEITVPVGQGDPGVWGAHGLNPGDSIIMGVVTRVLQAPGGGATLVSVGRSVNIDEYLQDGPVALGSTSNSADPEDHDGPFYNETSRVMKVTTDNDVTGSDMIIRVTVFYIKFYAPVS